MDLNDKQEILSKTLYSYIGYNNVEIINDEISDSKEEIKSIEISESLDEWFVNFNNNLENKEKKKISKKGFKSIISKIAMVFLIFCISITLLTATVDAFRVKLFNIILRNTEKYLEVEVEDNLESNIIDENLNGFYNLEYIPEGFIVDSIQYLGSTKIINYINKNNEEILFNQSPNGTNFQLDSEDAVIRKVDISGNEGIMLTKNGRNTLFWHNEEYSFYLISTINQEELVAIGKNIIKK